MNKQQYRAYKKNIQLSYSRANEALYYMNKAYLHTEHEKDNKVGNLLIKALDALADVDEELDYERENKEKSTS